MESLLKGRSFNHPKRFWPCAVLSIEGKCIDDTFRLYVCWGGDNNINRDSYIFYEFVLVAEAYCYPKKTLFPRKLYFHFPLQKTTVRKLVPRYKLHNQDNNSSNSITP